MNTTIFTNLTKQFTTSQELFAWLRSDEGGRLVVRETDAPYAMIFYDKEKTDMTAPHVEYFRSVVWDTAANKPVCVGPSRGLKFGSAVANAPSEFTTEEFVDGVMINLFYDTYAAEWQLATRSQLGATSHFYGKRSYADLFWETFAAKGLKKEQLVQGQTYSWVLQHPEERIVVAPAYGIASLTLIDGPAELQCAPTTYNFKTLEEVKEFVVAEGKRRGPQFQGVVLKTPEHRYKLRCLEYDEARTLRGNQPRLPFLWLERWSQSKLATYLRLYPEEQCDADKVIANFKACTQELHDLYLKVYRKKELPLGQAPQKYRKLLWDAHAAGKGAYFPHLRQFMNEQDTARKLWLVNYELRYGSAPAFTQSEATV